MINFPKNSNIKRLSLAKALAGGLLLGLVSNSYATPITSADIIADWTAGNSPIEGSILGSWNDTSGTIQASSNHVGSLVSNVVANSDFSFSTNTTASDNDTFGLIWGFQDLSNHYRFSWTRHYGEDGVGSPSGEGGDGIYDGFKIIKEVSGVSSILFSSTTEYSENRDYSLNLLGTATGFNVVINDITTVVAAPAVVFNQSIADTTFTSGKVGIHEFYQQNGNVWSDFDLNVGTAVIPQPGSSVPEPSTLAIFALGMIGLASRRFKK